MATVLIVEADEIARVQLRGLLASGRKFTTIAYAGSDADAVQEAASLRPGLIILDVRLSAEKLGQLVERFREIAPELPVFLLTDADDFEMEKRAITCGVTAVFSKADDPASLVANAEAIFEKPG